MAHNPSSQGQPDRQSERGKTVIETEADIQRALQAGLKGQSPSVPTQAGPGPVRPASSGEHAVYDQSAGNGGGRAASPFRPTIRPPMAILTVYDDGKTDGEVIRIRDSRFVIGRTEGDLRIPLDGRISSRHIEITHQEVGGLHRWVVTDLQSMHGLFARVTKTLLGGQTEFIVGNGRYRFDGPQGDAGATADYATNESARGATQGWDEGTSPFRPPALTELIGKEIGNRILLIKAEYWIGTDPTCAICRTADPFCEPRHVRLHRGPKGDWHAEHKKTLNGLWVRVPQVIVEASSSARFQIGEQRFMLRVQ